MNRLAQVFIGMFVAILAFGLTGHYGIESRGTVDVSIISLWLFSWLGDKKTALSFAVILGVIFDFISFTFFGYWLIIFVGAVLLVDWLKINFLTISSFIQAVLVLALITLLTHLITSLFMNNLNYIEVLVSILLNVLFGSILYYLLVIRLKMFQQWSGKRF